MGLSIITPHFNDINGIYQVHKYLLEQSSQEWEWIIIDDCSDISIQEELKLLLKNSDINKIKIVFRDSKTNASACRNKGVELAIYNNIVFLDADDKITSNFVKNRQIEVEEFIVLLNINIFNDKGIIGPFSNIKSDFINHFLKANFAWQTTCVLWNINFFRKIGQFNILFPLLEDIEITLRGLLIGENYEIINNSEVDFCYYVRPIDIKKRTVNKVSTSVSLLINNLSSNFKLEERQLKLLSAYYYLSVRYLVKSKNKQEVHYLKDNLSILLEKKCISLTLYFSGSLILLAFSKNVISDKLFLKLNRYLFKSEKLT